MHRIVKAAEWRINMADNDKKISKKKKAVYAIAGLTAAGALTAAVAANIGFIGGEFNPDKYSRSQTKKEDNIMFDGVAYSNGDDKGSAEKKRKSETEEDKNKKDESTLKQQPTEGTDNTIVTGKTVENGGADASAVNMDAVVSNQSGNGSGSGDTIPVISDRVLSDVSSSVIGNVPSGVGESTSSNTVVSQPDESKETVADSKTDNAKQPSSNNGNSSGSGGNKNNNTGGGNKGNGSTDSNNNGNTNTTNPSDNNGGSKPSGGGNHGGSSNGGNHGGNDSNDKPSNSNPSNSDAEAPNRDNGNNGSGDNDNTGGNSNNGGNHGGNNYSGTVQSMNVDGDFTNLSVGQTENSIFSSQFGRVLYLKFSNGRMVLRNDSTVVTGLVITGLKTTEPTEKAVANASFTYNTKKYSVDIPYSVVKWNVKLRMFDGSLMAGTLTPDGDLKIYLERYYQAFKSMNPKFIGWRCDGSDEIYTTELVMLKPDMELYPCVAADVPSKDDVGEEYTLTNMTDVDMSEFEVYERCKKLIIGADVKNISMDGIAKYFPNLEEIEVADGNSVYTSVDGILYKGKTLESVPPKKTAIKEFKEDADEIGANAFEGSCIDEVILPDTITKIGANAFKDAKINSLTITAEMYSVGDKAFYSSSDVPAVKTITSQTLYTANAEEGACDFGEAYPEIILPDSKYDRVYQYYMSSWGYMTDLKYGEGTAVKIFKTETKAEDRNTIVNGGVYSFFDSKDDYTLVSVSTKVSGIFTVDERTSEIADGAFFGCDGITGIVFNEKLKKVTSESLKGVTGINSITFKGEPPEVDEDFFKNLNAEDLKIYTPASSYEKYKEKWSDIIDSSLGEGSADKILDMDNDSFEVIDGARYIRDENGLILVRVLGTADEDFTVAEGTYKINDGAFDTELSSVIIPDTVKEIGSDILGEHGKISKVFINTSEALDENSFGDSILFVPESAADKYTNANALCESYKINSRGVISGNGTLIYVPKSYKGKLTIYNDINTVFEGAAEGCTGITEVIVGTGLTEIGANAFNGCRNIGNVDMSRNNVLTSIDDGAFYQCTSVSSISMPESLTNVGKDAFYSCDILSDVSMPGIETIGNGAFARCNSLVNFNDTGKINLAGNVKSLGTGAFAWCSMLNNVVMPTETAELAEGAFANCIGLKEVKDWGSINVIGENAFKNCGFYSVVLPQEKDAVIKSGAFAECQNLNNILIVKGIKELADDFVEENAGVVLSFAGDASSIEKLDGKSMVESGRINPSIYAAKESDVEKFFDEENVVKVEGGLGVAYESGGLYGVNGNEYTLLKVGKKSKTYNMQIDFNVTKIADDAFSDCTDIEKVTLTNTIRNIPDYAFAGYEKLKSFEIIKSGVIVDNGRIAYGDGVFKDCTQLETADVPVWTISIGNGVYENCESLKNISWGARVTKIPDDTFSGCKNLINFNISVEPISSTKSIGERAFKDCESLKEINGFGGAGLTFNTIESIGSNAFEGCSSMTLMKIPSTVKELGDNVFEGCDSLEKVNVYDPPFEIGKKVLGNELNGKYFYTGMVSDDVYNSFVQKWKEQLEEDYKEKKISEIVVRSYSEMNDGEVTLPDDNMVPASDIKNAEISEKNDDKVSESGAAAPSAEPKTTEQPEDTENPKTTERPKNTENPNTTEAPKNTEKPKTTGTPQNTEKPKATEKPEVSDKPNSSDSSGGVKTDGNYNSTDNSLINSAVSMDEEVTDIRDDVMILSE